MKFTILAILLFSFNFFGFSQNKKEQIEILSLKNDSLQTQLNLVSNRIDSLIMIVKSQTVSIIFNEQLINQKQTEISKILEENKGVKNDLQIKNDEVKKHETNLILSKDKITTLEIKNKELETKNKLLSDSLIKFYTVLNPTPTFKIEANNYISDVGSIDFNLKYLQENILSFNYNVTCKFEGEAYASSGKGSMKFDSECNCFKSEKFLDDASDTLIKVSLYKSTNNGKFYLVFFPASKSAEENAYCWEFKEKIELNVK